MCYLSCKHSNIQNLEKWYRKFQEGGDSHSHYFSSIYLIGIIFGVVIWQLNITENYFFFLQQVVYKMKIFHKTLKRQPPVFWDNLNIDLT